MREFTCAPLERQSCLKLACGRPAHSKNSCSGATLLANLSYDEGDVVPLFSWIEFANVFDNGVNESARRECAMTVQGFDQPMITKLFAGIVEGFGGPVGIEKEGIARE